ncbi:MAG: lysophospholipid acyltransferase family protein [Candidatus Neomarinimicrobiota bacterium]
MGIAVIIGITVVLLLLVVQVIRLVGTVESHTVREPGPEVSNLGWGHTIISLILWPLGIVSFLVGVLILIPLFIIIPPRYLHPLVRIFSRFVLLSIGVVVRVNGKARFKRPEAFIVMFNHESLFDVFVLGAVVYRYLTGLGASYQFRLPFWGYLLRRWGIIPIQRKNLREALKSINVAREKLKAGIPVMVSPEGTRTLDGKIREFKKGPFHLALGSGADILPMVLRGAFRIKQKTDWRLRPGVVRVEVGEFIPYEDYESMSVEEVRDYVREKILALAGEIL